MLGSNTELALQASGESGSNLERTLVSVMDEMGVSFRKEGFREIIGNDEIIWETYGIPMASISRYPYPEYHTDKDNLSIIHETSLEESVQILMNTIEELETSKIMVNQFKGTICTSNPRYDLYIPSDPSQDKDIDPDVMKNRRSLMDLIPTLHRPVTLRWISEKVGLSEEAVEGYLAKWEEKGLLSLQ